MGGILFTKNRDTLFEDEDLKTTKNQRLGPKERHNAPRAFEKCLGHDLASHAPRACFLPHSHAPREFHMRPVYAKSQGEIVFFCFHFG